MPIVGKNTENARGRSEVFVLPAGNVVQTISRKDAALFSQCDPKSQCTPNTLVVTVGGKQIVLPATVHLVGIGGSGMRALASMLSGWGCRLTGSDVSATAIESLRLPVVSIRHAHAAENVPVDADLVVHSDAVAADNIELRRAAELGIPTATYFQVVGHLTRQLRCVAVSGTHGKSTTTAMAAYILTDAGLDPSVLCGAAAPGQCNGGRAGQGDLLLVEACEYRRNFLHLKPHTAAILGIEPDHFDCYKTPEQLHGAFNQFAASVAADGLLLIRHDCEPACAAARDSSCRVETFAFAQSSESQGSLCRQSRSTAITRKPAEPDWTARVLWSLAGRHRFEILRRGRLFCAVSLRMPGRHNVLNVLAAAALAANQGVDAEQIAHSLSTFAGLQRRLEQLGTWRGVTIVDDYAHHPTEVAATLATVRQMYSDRRVCCVFQPHQASRTAHLLDELAKSLQNVDYLAVADIFRAREGPPRKGEPTAADLARAAGQLGIPVFGKHAINDIHLQLTNTLRPGDVLVTIGAGDIRRIADEYIHWTRKNRAAG